MGIRAGLTALAAVAALTATSISPATATTAAGTRPHVRFMAHFNVAAGQRPENITLDPNGGADITFAYNRQVAHVSAGGQVRILATMPNPPASAVTPALKEPFLGGITRAQDGTLYFLYSTGTSQLTGLYRLRPGGTPHRIAPFPANSLLNGMALNSHSGLLYIADSVRGTVWRVPTSGGTPARWATSPALAPSGFLGANGLKLHSGAVWVVNLDKGTVLRIPITRHGAAGTVHTKATGIHNIDDFAFTGHGDNLLAAVDKNNKVVLVRPDNGTHTTVLNAADGVQNPTSVAVRGGAMYVTSGAYFTNKDPNILTARISRGH
ncbi:hypothetical protein [Streptomyces sp. OE57]|uniref:hypothetical protein n=1 Tax=Streptomyces lacaronensis TaxID=3379885 RepID=UPI0039B73519